MVKCNKEVKSVSISGSEDIKLPYPIQLDKFDLNAPHLLFRILLYELKRMHEDISLILDSKGEPKDE